MKYQELTFGCDPEVFVMDKESSHFVSSCGRFGGTKENPRQISAEVSIQEDNVALEFNIVPVQTKKQWLENLKKARIIISQMLEQRKLALSLASCADFHEDQLNTPESRIFGCEPDYNAWTGQENPPIPLHLQEGTLRSAGGHIHVGYKDPSPEATVILMQAMDVFLGLPCTILDVHGQSRRQLYGKPGAFRYKSYGGEYRTLSNFWIFNPQHQAYVFSQTQKAAAFLNKGKNIDPSDSSDIQDAIMTANKEKVAELCLKYGVLS